MKSPGLLIRSALPAASLVLALAGILQWRARYEAAGAACLLIALAGLIHSFRSLEKKPFTADEIAELRPYLLPALGWLVTFLLILVSVINVMDHNLSPGTDRLAAAAWVAGLGLGSILVWLRYPRTDHAGIWLEWVKAHRAELFALAAILAVAFSLRTISLSTHPYPWSGDEASIGIEARRILSGEVTNFFETGWSSQPNWSFLLTALMEAVFGENILAIRLASAVMGTLAVLFVCLAGRELFSPAIGLLAGAFLATLPYHIHFSRVGVNNIADSLMSSLMFWLLALGMRKDEPRYYYAAGVAAGLSIYTYAGTRLILLLAGAFLVFLVFRSKGTLRSHWRNLTGFLVGTLLSAAPQMGFFLQHPDIFLGRFGQEGILLNGWLAGQAAQTGTSPIEILYQQFSRTISVFIASPAFGNFFNSPYPYLTVLSSILFLLGMGFSLAYLFEPACFLVLIWFWAVVFFGGVMTLNPPAHTRMLMTTPAISLFMAVGAGKILEYLGKLRLIRGHGSTVLVLLLILVIAAQNVMFYTFEYREQMYFQDPNGEFALEAGRVVSGLGDDFQVYILGDPRVFSGFPTLSFLLPDSQRFDLSEAELDTLELDAGHKTVFFAIPENRSRLSKLSEKFPDGVSGLVYRKPEPGEILFEYYILGREQ